MQIVSPPSGIKSIQRGTSLINSGVSNVNVAIALVNLSKATVKCEYRTYVAGTSNADLSSLACTSRFSSSTQIVLERGSTLGTSYVEWEVVEYA